MKICPKCNSQNSNNAVVCKNCGGSLNEISEQDDIQYKEEKPPYHIGLSFLFSFLSIIAGTCKEFFTITEGEEGYRTSNYFIYLACIAVALALAIIAARCLKGIFAKKPLPLLGIFAIMFCIATFALLVFDFITLIYVIPDMVKALG